MIKINLFPEGGRQPAIEPGIGRSPVKVSPVLLVGISALLSFGVVGGLGWYWSGQVARFEQQKKAEQVEQARLAAIQQKNQLYEKQVRELERRLHTVQVLEETRTGPVELMTALGNTVNQTRDLYLLSASPQGDQLLFEGRAASVESIAGFIAALKRSGSFAEVELRRYYHDDEAERITFKFDLNCVYRRGAGILPASGNHGRDARATGAATGSGTAAGASGARAKS